MSKRSAQVQGSKDGTFTGAGMEESGETAKRATAAQLANRKIKSIKPRRAGATGSGLTSGSSQGSGFGQQSGNPFGISQPQSGTNAANPFGFQSQQQSGGAFGTTNSFPPTQSATPGDSFTNSSFPTFGGGNSNSGFNFAPPTSSTFSFSAGGSNPFAASNNAPAANGTATGGFTGSIFNLPPQQSQANAAPSSTSIFSAQSNGQPSTTPQKPAPTSNLFGTASTTPFGQPPAKTLFSTNDDVMHTSPDNSPSKNNGSIAAQQSNPPPLMGSIFSSQSTPQAKPQDSASKSETLQSTSTSLGGATKAPATNPFANLVPAAPKAQEPAGNNIETPKPGGFPAFNFGAKPQETEKKDTETPKSSAPSPFESGAMGVYNSKEVVTPELMASTAYMRQGKASVRTQQAASTRSAEVNQPTSTIFSSGSQQSSTLPPSTPQASNARQHSQDSLAQPAPFSTTFGQGSTASAPPASSTAPAFSGFSTSNSSLTFTPNTQISQPTTHSLTAAATNAATAKPTSSLFSSPVKTTTTANTPAFNPFAPKTDVAPPKAQHQEQSTSTSNLQSSFAPIQNTPSSQPSVKFSASTAGNVPGPVILQDSVSTQVTDVHPALASFVKWKITVPAHVMELGKPEQDLFMCNIAMAALNRALLAKIQNTSMNMTKVDADMSPVCRWYMEAAANVRKVMDQAKKAQAQAHGVDGSSSVLSTKRKTVEDPVSDDRNGVASVKKSKGDAAAPNDAAGKVDLFTRNAPPNDRSTSNLLSTPTAQTNSVKASSSLFNSAPAKGTSQTSAIFSNALNKGTSGGNPGFQPNLNAERPSNTGPASTGFQPKLNASSSSSGNTSFQPNFGVGTTNGGGSGFQVPKFGGAGGVNFMDQFAKKSKTAEQIYEEAKQKAKDEDYDSDDEPYEAWSARYDAEQAKKRADQAALAAKAPSFTPSAPASNASSDSEASSKAPFMFPKVVSKSDAPSKSLFSQSASGFTSGASTNGLFGSRTGSPAPSTSGGASVFDTPRTHSASNHANIFGHLSGAESNGQDDSDEDDSTGRQSRGDSAAESTTPTGKRKHDQSESDNETLEETMKRKRQQKSPVGGQPSEQPSSAAAKTRSLFDRITRDDSPSAAIQDKASEQANGVAETPAKSTLFGSSFTPKTTLGGDQTFKHDSPIKFGQSTGAPSFSVTPASPANVGFSFGSSLQSNPPSTSLFAASASGSVLPSGFNSPMPLSRATTPGVSADEASGKESVNGKGTEDTDEGGNDAQISLAVLSEQEKEDYDVLFDCDISKCQDHEKATAPNGKATWVDKAKGPLWILKNKISGSVVIRMRVASGAVPVNFSLAALGADHQNKRVRLGYMKPDQKAGTYLFTFRTAEVAKEFATVVEKNKPS